MSSRVRGSNRLWVAGLGLLCGIFFWWGTKASSKQMQAALRDSTERSEIQRGLVKKKEMEWLALAQQLHDGPVQDLYGLSYPSSTYRRRCRIKPAWFA